MYFPRETTTMVTALSSTITPHSTSVPGHSTQATGVPGIPVATGNFDAFKFGAPVPVLPLVWSPIAPRDEPPSLPFPFHPDIDDQKYYRLDEDPLQGCIRDAIKEAGRERWQELISNGGWTNFLIESKGRGLVGQDSNYDANEVNGLLHQVRIQAVAENSGLDPATNETEKCAALVKRFTSEQMLDEIILSWAEDQGHIRNLPLRRPQPERRHVVTDVIDNERQTKIKVIDGVIGYVRNNPNVSDGNDHQILVKVGDDAIGFLPKRSHIPANATVPANSTLLANSTALHNSTDFIDWIFNLTLPGNSAVPDNSTLLANCTRDVDELLHLVDDLIDWIYELGLPGNSTVPNNSTLLATAPNNSTRHLDSLFSGNLTRRFNPALPANSTSHVSQFVRRSLNAASLAEDIFSEVDDEIAEGVRVASLADPDILEIFGQDGDRLKGFLDQPVVRDLMYATTKKHHNHGKHGKHGKKEDSVWADPKFVLKFIKDSVQGVKNSAQIVDGVVRAVEHKSHSKHKGHSGP
ncbi:hypothetical protein INS49_012054 [Diaporthe citri]|uniref:uncharacterized protein n=1 Tax=Diaporthe citri TaxID=83186 RepID=UPI001C7E6D73|nr:uncharacterized protein INS49_012054 [Diaporthe citri]KAG6358537.1 hypothetical protein INS49_012054 [Diaporthe citri]